MKINGEKLDKHQTALITRVKKSISKQKALLEEHGFDAKRHWNEMQDSLKNTKIVDPETHTLDAIERVLDKVIKKKKK